MTRTDKADATTTNPIVAALREGRQGIKYIAEIGGDRHVIDVPIDLVERHEDLTKIRAKDPADLSLLRDSMKKSSGPVYLPCVFIEHESGGGLRVFVADGHQRLQSARENGDERVVVQYMARWDSVKAAMEGAVSVQFARYEATEADVVSLLRSGQLMQSQVARLTGYDESKVSRLSKVAGHDVEWLYRAVQKGVIGLGQAGKLVDACKDNRDKLAALKTTFSRRFDAAEREAKFWENKIKSSNRKWDQKSKDKARVATYFRGADWGAWADVLGDDEGIEAQDGVLVLKIDDTGRQVAKSGVRIGDVTEWKKEFAVYGLFGKRIEEVDPADLDEVLGDWDYLRRVLEAIRDQRPIPAKNPEVTVNPPEPPAEQRPRMTIAGKKAKPR